MHLERIGIDEKRQRFLREFKILSQICHPIRAGSSYASALLLLEGKSEEALRIFAELLAQAEASSQHSVLCDNFVSFNSDLAFCGEDAIAKQVQEQINRN